jgi:hypothetical protein
MNDDEGLSLREAVEWCGSGVTVREITPLRPLAHKIAQPGRPTTREMSLHWARPRCARLEQLARVYRFKVGPAVGVFRLRSRICS